eukprot:COSAG02_NODE_4111_length_5765_cov_3.481115_4_plen_147_part_00
MGLYYTILALMQEYGNWFWVVEDEAKRRGESASTGGGGGRWVWVPSEDGLPQGSPLSVMQAALGGVRCVLLARRAMDEFNRLEREAPEEADPGVKEAVYRMAACAAEAVAMLDDATFVARMLALCEAFKAYVVACADMTPIHADSV